MARSPTDYPVVKPHIRKEIHAPRTSSELFNALLLNMDRQRLQVFEESFEHNEIVKITHWIQRREGQNQKQRQHEQCRKQEKFEKLKEIIS